MVAETVEAKVRQAQTVLERSFVLVLTCTRLGNEKSVNLSSVDLTKRKADGETEKIEHKEEYRLRQNMVDPKLLRPGHAAVDAAKSWLRSVATSGHKVFGAGTYIIAIPLIADVEKALTDHRANVRAAGAKIAAEWTAEVERRRVRLGPTFNAADYLRAEDVAGSFDIDWSYVSFSAPDRLVDVDIALAERATAKYEERLSAAFDEILLGMRGDALAILTELADRLGDDGDGKPKALRTTALRDLEDYLARLPARNTVVGDDALVAAMVQVQAAAQGITVEMLRDAPAVRAGLRAKAAEVATTLAGLVEVGRRGMAIGGLAAAVQ